MLSVVIFQNGSEFWMLFFIWARQYFLALQCSNVNEAFMKMNAKPVGLFVNQHIDGWIATQSIAMVLVGKSFFALMCYF